MTSSCISDSIWVKKEKILTVLLHQICLKFGKGGNFEMLITKSKPKLKLENHLSKNLQF